MNPDLQDSIRHAQTALDSLQANVADSAGFWHTLLNPDQWTVVNVLQAAAALIAIVVGIYGFVQWLRKKNTDTGNQAKDDSTPNPNAQNILAARNRYLERLIKRCQILPLAALGGEEGDEDDLKLDQIYVELLTTTKVYIRTGKRLDHERSVSAENDKESRLLSALEAAGQVSRLVILGDPGSGKSTFVKKLAAWQAAAYLQQNDSPSGIPYDLLPILVDLRDLVPPLSKIHLGNLSADQQRESLANTVLDRVAGELSKYQAKDFADELRESVSKGRCLLILDGLDEVPFDHRKRIRQAVSSVIQHHNVKRLIITCRIRSYAGDAIFPNFDTHTLAPFHEDQIKNFATAWYTAQRNLGHVDAVQAEEKAKNLANAALSDELRELAENPMILTTMAIIHQREIGLPKERVKLYNLAVDVLLRRWQKQRVGSDRLAPSPELTKFLKDDLRLRLTVERLAYEAHQTGKDDKEAADLARGDALTLLEKAEFLGTTALAANFLDYIDQRSGLLVGRGGEIDKPATYSFPHRTFQEYLAGCYLTGQRTPSRQIFALADQGEYWTQAVMLGAEALRYNPPSRHALLDLIYDLCPGGKLTTAKQLRTSLWSANMARLFKREEIEQDTDSLNGGKSYLNRLIASLVAAMRSDLTSIERAEAGNLLVQLGDPRPEVMTVDHMQFCLVPAGPFWMGERSEQHKNTHLDYNYWISRFPITVVQYRTFVTEKDHKPTNAASLEDSDNRPVRYVTWYEAMEFCKWLNDKWHQDEFLRKDWKVILPSEAEWEKAARGGEQLPENPIIKPTSEIKSIGRHGFDVQPNNNSKREYPWGNTPEPSFANYRDTKIGSTSAVGCFPKGASPYGCEEMSGNVWEWTRSQYENYPYNPKDGREKLDASQNTARVLRGGAFYLNRRGVRCSNRSRDFPSYQDRSSGFRVAVSPRGG